MDPLPRTLTFRLNSIILPYCHTNPKKQLLFPVRHTYPGKSSYWFLEPRRALLQIVLTPSSLSNITSDLFSWKNTTLVTDKFRLFIHVISRFSRTTDQRLMTGLETTRAA